MVATNMREISAGMGHSVAVTKNQNAMAWGFNVYGQLGDGTTINRSSPVPICLPECEWSPLGHRSSQPGGLHTLATTTDGRVWSWGWNVVGQLGDGTKNDRSLPKQVLPELWANEVSAGFIHSMLVSR
jgi:alpha-tubulin suppressor-like RCC1 family protein